MGLKQFIDREYSFFSFSFAQTKVWNSRRRHSTSGQLRGHSNSLSIQRSTYHLDWHMGASLRLTGPVSNEGPGVFYFRPATLIWQKMWMNVRKNSEYTEKNLNLATKIALQSQKNFVSGYLNSTNFRKKIWMIQMKSERMAGLLYVLVN